MDLCPRRLVPSIFTAAVCALAACSDSSGPDLTQSPYLFLTVAVGYDHTCGIRGDSTLLCWGYGYSGQLGDGEPWGASSVIDSRATPFPVKSNRQFKAVTAGLAHTCALAIDGTAYCWGSNAYGQLGNNGLGVTLPTAVADGLRFIAISASFVHTCAIALDGAGYCWGLNQTGALGDGTTEDRATPTAVAGGHRFLSLSAAYQHTCGIADDGTAYCWGANEWGQLGDLTDTARNRPTRVAGNTRFVAVSVGGSSSCGITSDHRLYCWGEGGQLGADAPDTCRPYLPDYDAPESCARAPVLIAVGADSTVSSVTVGGGHTCAISDAGPTYCWGYNLYGELGNGTVLENGTMPENTVSGPLAGSIRFATISASGHTTCGISVEGLLYCWGDNRSGQLGDDSGALSWPIPVVVWGW